MVVSNWKLRLMFTVSVLAVAAGSARAIPVPALDLAELTKAADVIAVGQVISVREGGAASVVVGGRTLAARELSVTLKVLRTLKGAARNDLVFRVVVPEQPIGYGAVSETQFGMFFLREQPSKTLVVANPHYPFLVASTDGPATQGEPLDQVIAELAHVVTSPATSSDDRVRAITILDKVLTPEATKALTSAAHSRHGRASVYAVAALLKRNETSVLDIAESTLLGRQPDEADLRRTLAHSIRDGVTEPNAVPMLSRLLKAADVETRRSAAAALRHVGTESVIEPLGLALHDGDSEVRYQAVLGLAAVTEQSEWAPSIDLFTAKEQHYLTYWKDWLKVR